MAFSPASAGVIFVPHGTDFTINKMPSMSMKAKCKKIITIAITSRQLISSESANEAVEIEREIAGAT